MCLTKNKNGYSLEIDNVVDLMVENGQISLEPDYTIQIGDDGLSRTNITIETVNITGLDSLSHLDLLYNIDEKYPTVKSNYSLGFSMNLDQLQIHLNGSVTLSPGSFIYHSNNNIYI
jgi:acyl carrier protein